MPFKTLPSRARKDPFAFTTFNDILNNLRATEYASLVEHTNEGKHNALEVARGVATAVWGGASYTLEGNTAYITGISRSSAGVTVLTLSAGVFDASMGIRISPMDNSAENVPLVATYEITSATSVTVRTWKLTSVLGAGNAWALTDAHYAIALHAPPIYAGAGVTAITNVPRGATLGGGSANRWNVLTPNQASLHSKLLAEHRSGGTHHAREIAYGFALASWDGAAYSLADSEQVSSIALHATGVARLTLPAGYTTPFQVFCQADYDHVAGNQYDLTVAIAPRSAISATVVDVYMYAYSLTANTWARAQFDFAVSIHHTPS